MQNIDRAVDSIPQKNIRLSTLKAYLSALVLNASTLSLAGSLELYGDKMIPIYIVTACVYIIGRLADKKSTIAHEGSAPVGGGRNTK